MAHKAFLLLGTNLGNRRRQLAEARHHLAQQAGKIVKVSRIYKTQPWGNTQQAHFLNQALCLNTTLSPMQLLEKILAIELQMGRQRDEKWGERLIDIDILFYEDVQIHLQRLSIPHPQFQFRNFAMVPMVEIAPNWVHPALKQSMRELLMNSADPLEVELWIKRKK